jgi:hypothetical protein
MDETIPIDCNLIVDSLYLALEWYHQKVLTHYQVVTTARSMPRGRV